jgi:hypothetical protein
MPMGAVLLDDLVLLFAFVFYAFLCVVYVLRARELSKWEWRLAPIFSVQLVPFVALWALNIYMGNDSGRLLTMLPVIAYLVYDLWYRLLSGKKPYHHPEYWPPGLIFYLALLLVGSIGLNWYGYLVSQLYGSGLVVAFFAMMSCYGYYQYSYNKKLRMTNKKESPVA